MGFELEEQYNGSLPRTGDVIEIPSVGQCTVLPGDDPSLIYLKTQTGAVLKIGDKALRDMLTLTPAERLRKEETGHE